MQLIDMNDDCIGHIFHFLNRTDKISAWLSCKRFANILSITLQNEIFYLREIMERVSAAEFREILHVTGPYIQRIAIDILEDAELEYSDLLFELCPNVKDIKVESYPCCLPDADITPDLVRRAEGPSRNYCERIAKFENLRALHAGIYYASWELLTGLTTLTELNLDCCELLKVETLLRILKANKNLLKLGLSKCLKSQFRFSRCPVQIQNQLEWLSVDGDSCRFFIISCLERIRNIRLICHDNLSPIWDFLDELTDRHPDTLETLEIIIRGNTEHLWDWRSLRSFRHLSKATIAEMECYDEYCLQTIYLHTNATTSTRYFNIKIHDCDEYTIPPFFSFSDLGFYKKDL